MDQTFCGDGSELVQGRVGMGVKSAVMGGDGTKIPSPCTPLVVSNKNGIWTHTKIVQHSSFIIMGAD